MKRELKNFIKGMGLFVFTVMLLLRGNVPAMAGEAKQVELGGAHSAVILTNGDLYCWGSNYSGQLGDGTNIDRNKPVKVLNNVRSVSLGGEHSAAILTNGDLYCWGWNDYGQLGDGTNGNKNKPIKILSNVKSVSLGGEHSAAILTNGDLYCWGNNRYGELGDSTYVNRNKPVKILSNVRSVSLGYYYSAAILTNGDLCCWGSNYEGELGDSTYVNRNKPLKVLNNVRSVSLGEAHSAAILTNGDLYCWGNNRYGELGDSTYVNKNKPVKVLNDVRSVSLGGEHSAAILTNGDLYCWGYNLNGELGDSTYVNRNKPVKVLSNVRSVGLGGGYSASILTNGDLYCWGNNRYGELGDGTNVSKNKPTKIEITTSNPTQYQVKYNANGGSGAPSMQKFSLGCSVQIPSQKPTRNGYSFLGWSKSLNAATASYSVGKSYNFDKNVTLYAVWKLKIPVCTDRETFLNVEKDVEKSAVSFANIFAKKAKSSKGTTTPGAVQQLKALKNELSITGYQGEVPDEVIEAFATAILDTIENANIDEYEIDPNKLTKQIYAQIKSGLNSGSKKITLGTGSKQTIYTVNYHIFSSSFGGFGAQVSWAEVQWRDSKNKSYTVHITANSTNKGMNKALASYCAVLAQLNKGLWKDFLVKYVTGGWNLAGLNSIKKLDEKTVSKYFDNSEKLMLTICGDKTAKKELAKDATGELKDKLTKMSKSKFREFIKRNVPNGDKLIKTADQYKKVKDKYDTYKKKLEKWEKTKKDSDLKKCEAAYEECLNMLGKMNGLLMEL